MAPAPETFVGRERELRALRERVERARDGHSAVVAVVGAAGQGKVGERDALDRDALTLGASSRGYGAVWSQADLRKALAKAGARVVEIELAVPHATRCFDAEGNLVDARLRRRVARFLAAVLDAAPMAAGV